MKTDEGMVTPSGGISLYLDGEQARGGLFGGCNSYWGPYALDSENGTISFDVYATLALCPDAPPELYSHEGMYIRLLNYDVTGYERNGDALRLFNSEGEAILLYGELPPAAYLPVICQ